MEHFKKIDRFAVMADESTDINGREILSIMIRQICDKKIQETFLCAVEVQSTTGENIKNTLVEKLVESKNIVAVGFDGGANFSGNVKGVQTLLKEHSPNLIFIHCRSHLLQLALVRAAETTPKIKKVLSTLNQLFSLFRHSHKRLTVLDEVEKLIDGVSHKLVQPAKTRWLSYDGSVEVVIKHYSAINISLEQIYTESGDFSSTAGGLLLAFKEVETLFYLILLSNILRPLARLSKFLQSAHRTLCEALK